MSQSRQTRDKLAAMRIFSAILQLILFYIVLLAGFLLDPFHMKWFVTHPSATSVRYYVPDGLILAFVLYVVILLLELVAKRIAQLAPWTTIAFVLAIVLGFLSKFGFATHDAF